MNVNGIGAAGYPAAGKAKVRQAQDGTQSFDREFMGMASQMPPSFVGKVWTKEELMQSVDKQVQSNQSKKMSVSDMIKATCIEGTRSCSTSYRVNSDAGTGIILLNFNVPFNSNSPDEDWEVMRMMGIMLPRIFCTPFSIR